MNTVLVVKEIRNKMHGKLPDHVNFCYNSGCRHDSENSGGIIRCETSGKWRGIEKKNQTGSFPFWHFSNEAYAGKLPSHFQMPRIIKIRAVSSRPLFLLMTDQTLFLGWMSGFERSLSARRVAIDTGGICAGVCMAVVLRNSRNLVPRRKKKQKNENQDCKS